MSYWRKTRRFVPRDIARRREKEDCRGPSAASVNHLGFVNFSGAASERCRSRVKGCCARIPLECITSLDGATCQDGASREVLRKSDCLTQNKSPELYEWHTFYHPQRRAGAPVHDRDGNESGRENVSERPTLGAAPIASIVSAVFHSDSDSDFL